MSDAERIAALERRVEALTDALAAEQDRRRAVAKERDQLLAQVDAGESHRIGLEQHVGAEQIMPGADDLVGDLIGVYEDTRTPQAWGEQGGASRAKRYADADAELERTREQDGLYSARQFVKVLGISTAALARWEAAKPPVVKGKMRKVKGLSVKTFTQADVDLGRKLREVQDEPVRRTLREAAAEARRRLDATA